jgi:hypothetical protein
MNRGKVLTLACVFFIDVHVRAETPNKECWGTTVPCAVQAEGGKKRLLTANDLKISLAPLALLEQLDEKTLQLVRGEFYVETSKAVVFKTPFGRVWCDDDCQGLFVRTDDSFNIKSLQGHWLVQRNGENTTYQVPTALQVTLGTVGEDGHALMEFPQSLPWLSTVKLWGDLYPGTFQELKPTLVKFRGTWKEAVEHVSELHQQAAARTIASYEEGLAHEKSAREAREHEDARLRALFHEKNP